jgi:hypothetical protein
MASYRKKTLAKINNPLSLRMPFFHPLQPTTQLKMGEKKEKTTDSKPTSLIKGQHKKGHILNPS